MCDQTSIMARWKMKWWIIGKFYFIGDIFSFPYFSLFPDNFCFIFLKEMKDKEKFDLRLFKSFVIRKYGENWNVNLTSNYPWTQKILQFATDRISNRLFKQINFQTLFTGRKTGRKWISGRMLSRDNDYYWWIIDIVKYFFDESNGKLVFLILRILLVFPKVVFPFFLDSREIFCRELSNEPFSRLTQ